LKAWVYVFWVSIFSTVAGLLYGAWVNGTGLGMVALYLVAFLMIIFGIYWLIKHRQRGPEKRAISHP
jgi:hypothetical protein